MGGLREYAMVVVVVLAASSASRAAEPAEGPIVLTLGRHAVALRRADGAIDGFSRDGRALASLRSGEFGLWRARFQDGSRLDASAFSSKSADRWFGCEAENPSGAMRLSYRSQDLDVAITATRRGEAVDLAAEVTPRRKTLVEFELPARLRFDPGELDRLVSPADGNRSVGTAYRGTFFQRRAEPTSWRRRTVGHKAFVALYGGGPVMREVNDPPVSLAVTDEGRRWLGPGLAARVARSTAVVNRPPQRGQADLVLVDSPHGAWFSASRLGGRGLLWRIGGMIKPDQERIALAIVSATIQRLASQRPAGRDKFGVISVSGGPAAGSFSSVYTRQWIEALRQTAAVKAAPAMLVPLQSVRQIADAEQGGEFLAILNPYGEGLPVDREGGMEEAVQRVGRYVRGGGNWFEVGGFPFFHELLPDGHYYEYRSNYPPAFADFFHVALRQGELAVYRVQPRDWAPWQGAKDPKAIFVPGRLGCGGDERGAWCERAFAAMIPAGQMWRCPTVRLALGNSALADLRAYGEVNGITRRLEDKMPAALVEKFKRSVLVYYGGRCQDKLAGLERLPSPALIHFADYLHGGFDKQYPDHLPPRPEFGTPGELRELFDKAHALGHLVMPYTNPTWWCDEPRGPTFERHGEAPLLRTLEGKLSREQYGANPGYTVCHWHPAVQEANRRTRRQFRDEYPVDVLFQDQCGARGWHYDANPASPTPYAYTEGLLSMIDEDSRLVPLSTESGWDRVVNAEAQLCGMTWGIVPTEHGPDWRRLIRDDVDPGTWEIFPMAQALAHDKTAMVHHDLGQFVTNREVLAWTLGLGFAMSCRIDAKALAGEPERQWLLWLDRVQKSVCVRYVGQPLDAFHHDRGPRPGAADDGLLRARYGSLEVLANLGPKAREQDGRELAAYGFFARAPGLVAANLEKLGGADFAREGISFVAESRAGAPEKPDSAKGVDLWVYAPAGQEVAALLPGVVPATVTVAFDGGRRADASLRQGACVFRLPSEPPPGSGPSVPAAPDAKYLWHAVVTVGR